MQTWDRCLKQGVTAVAVLMVILFSAASEVLGQTNPGKEDRAAANPPSVSSGPATEVRQSTSKDEVRHILMHDGKVVAEDVYQLDEMDVIIEFEGLPAIGLRGIPAAERLRTISNQRLRSAQLRGRITDSENRVLRALGKAPRPETEVIKREFTSVFYGVSARIQSASIAEIERIPGVRKVWRDEKVQAYLDTSVPLIRADKVWNDLGVTGKGILVAIVDTGIDYTHPDLGGCLGPNCKVVGGRNFVKAGASPMDDYGHGTHVAGIVAANGNVRGVAPDARLLAVKVLDQSGGGTSSWIIAGIEYALDPDGNPATPDGAQVINLSLGGSGTPDDPLSRAVDNAVGSGVVVCVAAGNSGARGYETIGSPGLARKALTVGASDDNDRLASFSSLGPATDTWQIKPEVLAPGVGITSTVPTGTCMRCDPSGYRSMSGTSMAAPHAAGAAALLLECYPAASPDSIKHFLMERAVPLRDAGQKQLNVFQQGSGRVDVYAAAVSTGLALPGNLSLGVADLTQPGFSASRALSVTNADNVTQEFTLHVPESFPSGVTVDVTPSALTLAPGETGSFTLSLSVDNSEVPNATAEPYHYEGSIIISSGSETLRLPFVFFKTPQLLVNFKETPLLLLVSTKGSDFFKNFSGPGSKQILLPEGSYDVLAQFGADHTVIQEDISVSTATTIEMNSSQAVFPVEIVRTGLDGEIVPIFNAVVFRDLQMKSGRYEFLITSSLEGLTSYVSSMSDNYIFEVSALLNVFPAKGPIYTFNAGARNGITGPIAVQNSAIDFKKIAFKDSVEGDVKGVVPFYALVGVLGGSAAVGVSRTVYSCSMPPLSPPFVQEAYLLPPPYPEFHLGYVQKRLDSVTSKTDCLTNLPAIEYRTPLFRPDNKVQLNGYWYKLGRPVFSTTAETVDSGLGPYSWYGVFSNSVNTISYFPVNGVYSFASQTRDLRSPGLNGSVPYELYQGSTLVSSGNLGSTGFLNVSGGSYRLKLALSNFVINGNPGLATVNATMNLAAQDRNPPYVTQFTVQKGGRLVSPVTDSGGEQVRVVILDDVGVAAVSMSHDEGNGWQDLVVTREAANAYVACLPAPQSGRNAVGLRLTASDGQGNALEFETQLMVTPSQPNESELNLEFTAEGAAAASTTGSFEPLRTGYAKLDVEPSSAPYAAAVFSMAQNGAVVSEAGVPASPPTSHAALFAEYRSLPDGTSIDTGVALVNPNSSPAQLFFRLRDADGAVLATGEGSLGPKAHTARFLGQLDSLAPGFRVPPDFAARTQFGMLEILADPPISVLALRLTVNQRNETLITATPIADLDLPSSSEPLFFPQLADGAGFKTTLVLMNGTGQVETGTLFLWDDTGMPLSVRTSTGQPAGSSFRYQIPPGGLYLLQTDGSGAAGSASPVVGWMKLVPDDGSAAPAAAGLFGYSAGGVQVTESAVPPAGSTIRCRIFLDQSGGHMTGIALANLSDAPAIITATAFQSDGITPVGYSLGPATLAANGHASSFVDSFVSGLPPEFTGILELSSTTPFAALTLRGLFNSRGDFLMTTLPTADLTRPAAASIVFPQIADGYGGGSYMTQFIMLGAGSAASAKLGFFDDNGQPLAIGKSAVK